jgi:hypothetical protein
MATHDTDRTLVVVVASLARRANTRTCIAQAAAFQNVLHQSENSLHDGCHLHCSQSAVAPEAIASKKLTAPNAFMLLEAGWVGQSVRDRRVNENLLVL